MWRTLTLMKSYSRAKTIYQLHNEYIYTFVKNTYHDRRNFYIYGDMLPIEQYMRRNTEMLELEDYGAGSLKTNNTKRSVCEIYRQSSSSRQKAKLLSKITRFIEPKAILEMGTNLGIGSAYLAGTFPKRPFYGIEGSHALHKKTIETLTRLNIKDFAIILGTFDDHLEDCLRMNTDIELIYIDGHHDYTASLRYYETIKTASARVRFLIFDDIYWNKNMYQAWMEIMSDPFISFSLELYPFGIVCLDKSIKMEAKNHIAIPWSWKPWALL